MRFMMQGCPVRIAVPAGPKPRLPRDQVTWTFSTYPWSSPACATGRTLFPGSSSLLPHPGKLVLADLHDGAANRMQQFIFIHCPHQSLIAAAQHA